MVEHPERRLRDTFDRVALLYDQVRPGYPETLFDDVVELSGIPPEGRILEVGTGTGQATLPFARRGYRVFSVELGSSLAAVARRNLAAYPRVKVHVGAFEDWPVEESVFDLAVSATAFHWIDPEIAYPKVARALKPGGTIALFWNKHVHSEASEDFFETTQEVYQREAPELAKDRQALPRAEEIPEPVKDELRQTGLFGEATVRKYRWDAEYDAAEYVRLLNTYSSHRNLDDAARERLYHGISGLIEERYGGRITKGYSTILYVARRKPGG